MDLPFTDPPYSSNIPGIGGDDLVNLRGEVAGTGAAAQRLIVHTPGLSLFATQNTVTACRGLCTTAGGRVFQVAGVNLFEIQNNGGRITRGTISSGTGPVGMQDDGQILYIVDGVQGYTFDLIANTITAVADADFPDGSQFIKYANGYFLALMPGTGFLRWSDPVDRLTWPALNVSSAEASPDIAVSLEVLGREAWVFGSLSTQVFYVTEDADNAWQPVQSVAIDVGTEAPHSVAAGRDAIFFLGSGREGSGRVFRTQGYQVVPISTPGIEGILSTADGLADAVGRYHSFQGHSYYVLTIAAAERTLVYDVDLGEWHERAWRDPSTGILKRWRGAHATFGHGLTLVGDSNGDAVYSLDGTQYHDDKPDGSGTWIIHRQRTTPHVRTPDGRRIQFPDLELHGAFGDGTVTGQGVAPECIVSHSDDGGRTWSPTRTLSVGALGNYTNRARALMFGMARDRLFRITQTDPVPVAWYGLSSNAVVLPR